MRRRDYRRDTKQLHDFYLAVLVGAGLPFLLNMIAGILFPVK